MFKNSLNFKLQIDSQCSKEFVLENEISSKSYHVSIIYLASGILAGAVSSQSSGFESAGSGIRSRSSHSSGFESSGSGISVQKGEHFFHFWPTGYSDLIFCKIAELEINYSLIPKFT